jgi:hypothetical protein
MKNFLIAAGVIALCLVPIALTVSFWGLVFAALFKVVFG